MSVEIAEPIRLKAPFPAFVALAADYGIDALEPTHDGASHAKHHD